MKLWCVWLSLLILGCTPKSSEDDGAVSADSDADADADADADSDVPLDGFGEISGDCGVIDFPDSPGQLYRNAIDFGTLEFDEGELSTGGAEIFEEGTLGGSSVHSEIFAYEVLHRCEIAFLVKSETEIEYNDDGGKKTDMLLEIDLEDVGVSVTRAFHWPPEEAYTADEAFDLLDDKLSDVLLSAENAADSNLWNYALLHVMAYSSDNADRIEEAYATLPGELKDDIIVMVTVTDGDDDFLY